MLQYPVIDPIAFEIGPLAVRWYGITYLVAFATIYMLALRYKNSTWNSALVADLLFYVALGVIFGGRIGYVLFYEPATILTAPQSLLTFWVPGRSFHGGLLGVLVAVYLYGRRYQRSFLTVTDFIAPLIPIGLACGRLGNFINGELWGRITDVPWAMVFWHIDNFPRHPSQLYQLFLEGVVLFIIMELYRRRLKAVGALSGMFLLWYGILRIIGEFYREPDVEFGLIFNWITMGQLLSLPMIVVGIWLYWVSQKAR